MIRTSKGDYRQRLKEEELINLGQEVEWGVKTCWGSAQGHVRGASGCVGFIRGDCDGISRWRNRLGKSERIAKLR